MERKVRVLRFSVEDMHAVRLQPNHHVVAWRVEYSSQIMTEGFGCLFGKAETEDSMPII